MRQQVSLKGLCASELYIRNLSTIKPILLSEIVTYERLTVFLQSHVLFLKSIQILKKLEDIPQDIHQVTLPDVCSFESDAGCVARVTQQQNNPFGPREERRVSKQM